MSPVSLTLDLLLAALLLITLGFGVRLDRRLKSLKASQDSFAVAVADLDRAASRAEGGLAELRGAMDESVDLLAGRIEKARELAVKLETLTTRGAAIADRPTSASQRSALDRAWARPANPQTPAPARAEAAAERLALTLTADDALPPPRLAPALPTPRSRAMVDDELFDGPALRRIGGAYS